MKKKYMETTDYLEARARQPSHAEKLFVLGGKFLSEPWYLFTVSRDR